MERRAAYAGKSARLVLHRLARLGVEQRRRRLLQHLLVAALHRALALGEANHVAVVVGNDLDLRGEASRVAPTALKSAPPPPPPPATTAQAATPAATARTST
jgi:hypothetical protein